MPFSYRIKIENVQGTHLGYLYTNEPISNINSFSSRGNGDCVEAIISVKYIDLSIKPEPLYRVQLQVTDAGFAAGTIRNLFAGYVVRAGASRNMTRLSEIKLVGLRNLFASQIVQDKIVTGGDVAAMVRAVLSQAVHLPAGINAVSASATDLIPDTGFSVSDRYPNLETVESFLDDMASYIEGAQWGVNGDKDFFFRVFPETYNVLEEGQGVNVVWEEPDLEGVADKVTLILADKPFPDGATGVSTSREVPALPSDVYVPFPVSHHYDSGEGYDIERLELIPWADAWLSLISMPLITTTFANSPNVHDDDFDTFASLASGTAAMECASTRSAIIAAKITYLLPAGSSVNFRIIHTHEPVLGGARGNTTSVNVNLQESDAKTTQLIIAPIDANLLANDHHDASYFRLTANAAGGQINIYEIELFELDTTTLDNVAQAYVKLPAPDAGEVQAFGVLLEPSTNLDLTLENGETIRVPTEMFSSKITKEEGLMTSIRIGQPLTADDMALNKLEKDRLNQATFSAVRFRK